MENDQNRLIFDSLNRRSNSSTSSHGSRYLRIELQYHSLNQGLIYLFLDYVSSRLQISLCAMHSGTTGCIGRKYGFRFVSDPVTCSNVHEVVTSVCTIALLCFASE